MKTKKVFTIVGAVLAIGFGCTWMLAQAHPGGHQPSPHRQLSGLDLSAEQMEQWQNTMRGNRQSMEELHILRQALRQLSLSDDYDSLEAQDVAAQIGELSEKMAIDRANATNDFYQSLSDEQRQKFAEFAERRRGREQRHLGR